MSVFEAMFWGNFEQIFPSSLYTAHFMFGFQFLVSTFSIFPPLLYQQNRLRNSTCRRPGRNSCTSHMTRHDSSPMTDDLWALDASKLLEFKSPASLRTTRQLSTLTLWLCPGNRYWIWTGRKSAVRQLVHPNPGWKAKVLMVVDGRCDCCDSLESCPKFWETIQK